LARALPQVQGQQGQQGQQVVHFFRLFRPFRPFRPFGPFPSRKPCAIIAKTGSNARQYEKIKGYRAGPYLFRAVSP